MNQFFYLALSFYASRNSDIEGTGEKVSSSILISIYIIIVDLIIYLISTFLNIDSNLRYIQIAASIISLTICTIFIINIIYHACIRKDCKFFIYLIYIITCLGPCSNCIFKNCCDCHEGKCFCLCCDSKKKSLKNDNNEVISL